VAIRAISRIQANLCVLFHRKLDFSQIAEIGNSGFEETKRTVSSLFHLSGKLRTNSSVFGLFEKVRMLSSENA
jgi:hypothetical protein